MTSFENTMNTLAFNEGLNKIKASIVLDFNKIPSDRRSLTPKVRVRFINTINNSFIDYLNILDMKVKYKGGCIDTRNILCGKISDLSNLINYTWMDVHFIRACNLIQEILSIISEIH